MRLFVSLAVCLISTALSAAEPGKTILVLDCSGSMWGTIRGRTKIDIAREAVAKVVSGLPASTHLGLMAYGHRRKGDCEDIELLIPPGPLNRASFLARVKALEPLGKTPLTRAVGLAAEALKYEEQEATVILVSDGLESCGGDPCELAEKLEKAGVKFTTHVVGFDITKEESAKISCLASVTGGLYLPAHDASSLQTALQSVVQSVQQKKSGAIFLARDSKTSEALRGASWKVYRGKAEENPVGKLPGSQGTLLLEPGSYHAVAEWKQQTVSVDFVIAEGQTVPVEAAFGPAIIRLIACETPDSPPIESASIVHWSAAEIKADGREGENFSTLGDEAVFQLPPGKYRVKFARGTGRSGEVAGDEIIEVKAGDQRTVRLVVPSAIVSLTAKYGGVAFTTNPWIEVFSVNEQGEADERKRFINVNDSPIPALLPPGKYEARSESGAAKASGRFEVEAGKDSAFNLDFDAGLVRAKATFGDRISDEPRWWYIYPATADGKKAGGHLYQIRAPELEAVAPAGDVLVTVEIDHQELPGISVKVVKGKITEGVVPVPK